MAQDEKQRPEGTQGAENDAPVSRNEGDGAAQKSAEGALKDRAGTATPAKKQDDVDLASLDAFGVDTEGEFVRDGGKSSPGKKNAEKTPAKNTATKTVPSEKKKEKYVIPVLRTYHHDTKKIAQTKGGAELRTILAKETEEKRMAQEEYRQNTKDIMKESAVLRDRYENFTQRKQKKQSNTEKPDSNTNADKQSIGQENITRTLSGATAYMQSMHNKTVKEKGAAPALSKPDTLPPQEQPPKQSEPTLPTATPDKKTEQSAKGPEKQKKEKKGIFARMRGRELPENSFTEEERGMMRQKQQESVEKEAIKGAWKDFKKKKKKLQEMGLRARDVRSYAVTPDKSIPSKIPQRQNILLFAIIFFLLAGLVFFILFLALTPAEKPVTDNTTADVLPVPDILNSENQVFVNTTEATASSDDWRSITEQGSEQDTVTKYVPYEVIDEKESQISLQDFSSSFRLRFPSGLQNTFDSYYFVGKYETQGNTSGILIISVKKYGDAFVWMRNWEKNAINAFSAVFPGVFRQVNINNVITESRVIDNQDVRVIRHPSYQKEILYYFFGRSVLVFVVGDTSAIPFINARIRAANTL